MNAANPNIAYLKARIDIVRYLRDLEKLKSNNSSHNEQLITRGLDVVLHSQKLFVYFLSLTALFSAKTVYKDGRHVSISLLKLKYPGYGGGHLALLE